VRILYVCHTFPWVTQSFTVREVALLRSRGVDVEVLAFHRPEGLMDEQATALLKITHFVPPALSRAFLLGVARAAIRRPKAFARLVAIGFGSSYLIDTTLRGRMRGIFDIMRGAFAAVALPAATQFHAELADNACTAAMAASELSGKPFTFKSHSSFNPQALGRKASGASFIALASEFDAGFFFPGVPPSKLFVNRGGVLQQEQRPARVVDTPDLLRVLSVGTLQEKKGQIVLIEALRILTQRDVPVTCTMVGSGPLEATIRKRLNAAGLRDAVSLTPYRPHAEVKKLYSEHDVFALPCVVAANGDRDGLPAVLIEAAAAGCIPVSCAVSGIPELVDDGKTGLLVPERDPAALADALERLARDAALRSLLRQGCLRIIRERFDLERNVADLAERFANAGGAR
jgi:colanic acid/amylovoran biosynthesis glycosyltransferase